MTNLESGERLLQDAKLYLQEAENYFTNEKWNPAVRRAQEVVELSIKGLLKIMGVEYPRVHDPSKYLIKKLEEKEIPISEDEKQRIVNISLILTSKRAPAFYHEEDYTREDAEEAIDGARWMSGKMMSIKKQIIKE